MSQFNLLALIQGFVERIRLDVYIGWIHDLGEAIPWTPVSALLWLPIAWILVFWLVRILIRRVVPKLGKLLYGVAMLVVGALTAIFLTLDVILATCSTRLGMRPWYELGDRTADAGAKCEAGLKKFTAERLPSASNAKWLIPGALTLVLLLGWWTGDGCADASAEVCVSDKDVWWNYTSTLVADSWVPAITGIFSEP